MSNPMMPPADRMSLRNKARLNICIAKDLAENFGGRKADYLIKLNRKLRMNIALSSVHLTNRLIKAAENRKFRCQENIKIFIQGELLKSLTTF